MGEDMTLSPLEAPSSSLCSTGALGIFGVLAGQRLRSLIESGDRRKGSINILSKKFRKDVKVVDSSYRLPSVLARRIERCRPANFEQ
jgi:hypothetical protein